MKRRDFLRSSGLMTLPVMLGKFSVASVVSPLMDRSIFGLNDKILVLIQLKGGNDTLNTVIPVEYYDNLAKVRGNIVIPEKKILQLTDATGLHPSLQQLMDLWDGGRMSVIQSVGYPNQNRSHFRSTDIWHTASDADEYLTTGWLGRYFTGEYPNYPEGYPNASYPHPFAITIGSQASETCQGVVSNFSIAINGTSGIGELFEGEWDEVPDNCYGQELQYVRQLVRQTNAYSSAIEEAFEKGKNVSDKYEDDNRLAQQLKIVAQLISGGLKTSVYVVSLGGFDTHSGQVEADDTTMGTHATLLSRLANAVNAFMDDILRMGYGERVLALTYSEFGRRIIANASNGTDHGDALALFAFGECVEPGIVGVNPEIPSNPSKGESVPMQYDFRAVYSTVFTEWFDVPEDTVQNILFGSYGSVPFIRGCLSTRIGDKAPAHPIALEVLPNPSDGVVHLKIPTDLREDQLHVQVFNEYGRIAAMKVAEMRRSANGTHVLDLRHLPSGVYFIQVQTPQWSGTKRIVLQ